MPSDEFLALPDAPPEFSPYATAVGRPTPTYSALYALVVNGALPSVRIGRSRYFERARLPEILEKLGLVAGAEAKSPKSRKVAAAPVRDTLAA